MWKSEKGLKSNIKIPNVILKFLSNVKEGYNYNSLIIVKYLIQMFKGCLYFKCLNVLKFKTWMKSLIQFWYPIKHYSEGESNF